MIGSVFVYSGLVVLVTGVALVVRPASRVGIPTRARALAVVAAGLVTSAGALAAPAFDSRVAVANTRLDAFMPAWQFHEVHARKIAAPTSRVYDAVKRVRADEILLFRTLTWIRRGGRSLPPGILNAGDEEALIDLATRTTFVRLADDVPRELVVGTVVGAPAGYRRTLMPTLFQAPAPAGFALATMNFKVTPDGAAASIVTTETRVFATDAAARRRFAAYWRLIYPGSAIIRRMWLRAIERRALS
jgi:hypothetical protein